MGPWILWTKPAAAIELCDPSWHRSSGVKVDVKCGMVSDSCSCCVGGGGCFMKPRPVVAQRNGFLLPHCSPLLGLAQDSLCQGCPLLPKAFLCAYSLRCHEKAIFLASFLSPRYLASKEKRLFCCWNMVIAEADGMIKKSMGSRLIGSMLCLYCLLASNRYLLVVHISNTGPLLCLPLFIGWF